MSDQLYSSTGVQLERIERLLPEKVRDVPRVDERRVIPSIVHALKSGGR